MLLSLRLLCCAAAALLLAASAGPEARAQAAPTLADTIGLDPAVRRGVLPNGLVYYVRANDEPRRRAELRLAVDAGSVLEDDDQRGMAHFLEHMLFNGTERFPEHALVDFLELTGSRFGADINASTSFDETIYTLTVPTDTAGVLAQALDVLEDWAGSATLSEAEIDKERGVVLEEWRLSQQNANGRILNQLLPVYLQGSAYAERLPIGDTLSIRTASYDAIRRYYRTWYRPDLMAVVAVGDFDAARVEAMIRERFGRLRARLGPRPQPPTATPPGARYKVAADPEFTSTSVEIVYTHPAPAFATEGDYRRRIVSNLFNGMLNDRFQEISRRPDAPFLGAGAYRGGFVRPIEVYGLQARVQEDSVDAGLAALVTEASRVRRHGFTPTELERQKRELLRSYERAYNERENTASAAYADEYVAHYLEGTPAPGIAYELELIRRLLPELRLEEVNALAAALLAPEGRAVIVTMPQKPGRALPAEQALAAVIARAEARPVAPYEDAVPDAPLVAAPPDPAAIVSERALPEVGAHEITLANGVTVVYKQTDFKDDEVRFTAYSPGGSSLVPDADVFNAETADALVSQSGLGAFDRSQLQKMLSGKVVSVSPFIQELREGLSGSASPADLETMFQLIHLFVTAPRMDSTALAVIQNQYRAYLANRSADPQAAFQDSLQAALFGAGKRYKPISLADVDALSLERARAIYADRFGDAGDFTFYFVGAFDPERLRAYAQTYLGALPARGRSETWRDVSPDLPQGVVEKTVRKGAGQQSQVALVFNGPFDYNRETRHLLRSLSDVLTIRLRDVLREDLGGVYGVGVRSSASDQPDSTYSFIVSFAAAPERVEELVAAVFSEVARVQQEGVEASILSKVQEQQRREREVALRTNGFWLGVLDFYYTHPNEPMADVARYEDLIGALDNAKVREAARRYLDAGRFVKVVLYPEEAAPQP